MGMLCADLIMLIILLFPFPLFPLPLLFNHVQQLIITLDAINVDLYVAPSKKQKKCTGNIMTKFLTGCAQEVVEAI